MRHLLPTLVGVALVAALPASAQPTTTTAPATVDFAIDAVIGCTLLWSGTDPTLTIPLAVTPPLGVPTPDLTLDCSTNSNQTYDISVAATQTAGAPWENLVSVLGLGSGIDFDAASLGGPDLPLGQSTAAGDNLNVDLTVSFDTTGQDPDTYSFTFEVTATGI